MYQTIYFTSILLWVQLFRYGSLVETIVNWNKYRGFLLDSMKPFHAFVLSLSTFPQVVLEPAGLEVHITYFLSSSSLLNCSLLCSKNKLPVISLPLKSPAPAEMREICLRWAPSGTPRGSAAARVSSPGETSQDGCAILWWATCPTCRES